MEYNIISSDECKAPYQHNYFGCKWRLGNKASPYYWTLYTKQMLPEPSGVMPIQAAGESGHELTQVLPVEWYNTFTAAISCH